ncbi:DMT family transporter [Luteimonas sp. Y-2-2-4F]|nr:DMT family transporter [Luteimonas sp. Y-2-2-4F]MCD9033140.1 DMT family transporter [Luteimonas sp. Y-2-2-4F]
MNPWIAGGIALAVGMVLPLQALINARLGQTTSGSLFAAFASFLVGTLALGAALLATRTRLPPVSGLLQLPAWIWLGGLLGAAYILSATVLVTRLGAASLICLIVLGQLAGSLLLDHFGVLSAARPADWVRVLGALLVATGALLVVRPWGTPG